MILQLEGRWPQRPNRKFIFVFLSSPKKIDIHKRTYIIQEIMSQYSIGNDIVDLHMKEPDLHPRFKDRVFSKREKQQIGNSPDKLWLYWSAKEAAYKAIKRLDASISFSPIKFEFNSDLNCVVFNQHKLACRQILNSEYAYTTCLTSAELLDNGKSYDWIEVSPTPDPSTAVRKLALTKISAELGVTTLEMEIANKSATNSIPYLKIKGLTSPHLLSFSHHGRFVACAFLKQN